MLPILHNSFSGSISQGRFEDHSKLYVEGGSIVMDCDLRATSQAYFMNGEAGSFTISGYSWLRYSGGSIGKINVNGYSVLTISGSSFAVNDESFGYGTYTWVDD